MAKQKLTIEVDVRDGYELKYNPETRTIVEVKTEPIRSKSWEEFCNNHKRVDHEWYITNCGNITAISASRECPNNLATMEDAEGILALIQLTRLHDEWVGGLNYNLDWYAIYYEYLNKRFYISRCYHQLNFPTETMAREFLYCFKDLLEKAKKFI